jgi:Domain of unknown function (DUF4160)
MPRISDFYGIVIAMFYSDHDPPHVQMIVGDDHASVAIAPVAVTAGALPPRAEAMVFRWTALHQTELLDN